LAFKFCFIRGTNFGGNYIQTINDMIGKYIVEQEFSFCFRDVYNNI